MSMMGISIVNVVFSEELVLNPSPAPLSDALIGNVSIFTLSLPLILWSGFSFGDMISIISRMVFD